MDQPGRRSLLLAALTACIAASAGCRPGQSADSAGVVESFEEGQVAEPPLRVEAASDSLASEFTPVTSVRVAGVKARLDRHLRRWALRSPENTWALIHALLVYPPDTKLPEHDLTILEAILEMATTVELGGKTVPTFTGHARDGTPREPHANQVLMVLLLAGISLDHPFEAEGHGFTVRDLLESALWRFEPPHQEKWEHESWTLTALARASRVTGETGFTNHEGQRFEGRELVQRAAAHLNREMQFIEDARQAGAQLEKRRQGVHAHPCGGLHLAATPALWMADTEVRESLVSAMRRAASTLAWRVTAEHEVYERTRAAFPDHDIMISGQEMKFYGHWLETMADLRDAGVEVDQAAVERGIAYLVEAVERLDRIGALERMDDIRERRVQTYRDLIGDAAHALRGLRLWTETQR